MILEMTQLFSISPADRQISMRIWSGFGTCITRYQTLSRGNMVFSQLSTAGFKDEGSVKAIDERYLQTNIQYGI